MWDENVVIRLYFLWLTRMSVSYYIIMCNPHFFLNLLVIPVSKCFFMLNLYAI